MRSCLLLTVIRNCPMNSKTYGSRIMSSTVAEFRNHRLRNLRPVAREPTAQPVVAQLRYRIEGMPGRRLPLAGAFAHRTH